MASSDAGLSRPEFERPDLSLGGDQLAAVLAVLERDRLELAKLEEAVEEAFRQHRQEDHDPSDALDAGLTFGQRLSDRVAEFGGSWTFLIVFGVIITLWVIFNALAVVNRFDPYPFILLNLILSCVAAVQAPIIMMSQNRQEAKDRFRAQHDYRVNLKAELEIRELHDKMDHLLYRQMQRLLEIQRLQVELLSELRAQAPSGPPQM
ncbi:MAG: DUF1003 domain-containing protein [Methanoregulaceae archaeon]|nr:DUF1003 domain-containing protein [Methanoregulaceae archaeon]